MLIKLINENDIQNVENCGKESLPIYYCKSDLLMLIYDKNYILYMALDNKNNFCGFMISNICKNRVHIMSIAVYEKFRNLNVGTSLINHLKKNFTENIITLNVQQSNKNAINFYKKNNFFIVKELKKYYSNLDCNDAYQMLCLKIN